jgi:hypothetical protein
MTEGGVSPEEVRACWAYSELLSGRYDHVEGIAALLGKARQHVPFAELAMTERQLLVRALHEGRGGLQVGLEGISAFQLTRWGHRELAEVLVILYFVQDVASPSLVDRLSIPFKIWIEAEPIRPLPQGHARFAIYEAARIGDVEPLTIGLRGNEQVLLDGYHRAVRFWHRRTEEPTATLPVFVPLSTPASRG